MSPDLRSALAEPLRSHGGLIYARMTQLAAEHDAINLAQGFPEEDGPASIRRRAAEALVQGPNQYVSSWGLPALRQAIASRVERDHQVSIDSEKEIVITAGGQEALSAAFLALVQPGEEVILFEPFYASYLPMAALARARVRAVPMGDRGLDEVALRAAMSAKTRLVVINSPGNPSGRMLRRGELELIAALCEEHDAWLISDEVYEELCYDERRHTKAIALPELATRAISISSFGKAFGLTGWRLGHVIASAPLAWAVHLAHQQMSYCAPAALQLAALEAWRAGDAVLASRKAEASRRRDQLCGGLREFGLEVEVPEGGYFCSFDIRPLGFDDDVDFCEMIVGAAGVAMAPMSVSWKGRRGGRHLVRLCFAKREQTITAFLERFGRFCARSGRP